MPVRIPLVTDPAARVLLDGLIDYAGLFPPAAVSMSDAVRQYARARGSDAGWMLGRFICPVVQLETFGSVAEPLLPRDAGAIPWRIAAIGSGDHVADAAAIAAINESHRWSWDECSAVVDTVETRVQSVDDIQRLGAFAHDTMVYAELPMSGNVASLVAEIARTGRRAKLRAGGITAEALPEVSQVAGFIDACVGEGVPFKATAGLHHALRGTYPLTYAADSPHAPMYGFLNMLLATALRLANADRADVEAALQESDRDSITFTEDAISWHEHRIDRTQLAHLRERVFTAFGSCSFAEPVADVRSMVTL